MKIVLQCRIHDADFKKTKQSPASEHWQNLNNALPVSIQKVIPCLFEKLLNPAFLSDCSNPLTSNGNKTYHHVLLDLVPKELYTSSEAIELAAQLSVFLYSSDFY